MTLTMNFSMNTFILDAVKKYSGDSETLFNPSNTIRTHCTQNDQYLHRTKTISTITVY